MRVAIWILLASVSLLATAVYSQPIPWVVVSTEVDENLDGSGFRDRHALYIEAPNYTYPGGIFWDPGYVIGVDAGLDAYHFMPYKGLGIRSAPSPVGQHFFSTEVDFAYNGGYYTDQQLLVYDTVSGALSVVFDVNDILGDDYGLDAIAYIGYIDALGYQTTNTTGLWAFSTEVGMELAVVPGFTDGDILITDGTSLLDIIYLSEVFGRNVGLDALHLMNFEYMDDGLYIEWLISTEVDGYFNGKTPGMLPTGPDFRDEDLIAVGFLNGQLVHLAKVWTGVDAFGRDVGLDAVYLMMIPEPSSLIMVGLGMVALAILNKRRK